jgi:hypothetical protein
MPTIVVQKWEESERDWGIRPDGWTMYLNMEVHAAYMEKFNAERQAEYQRTKVVPDEYTRPSGSAYAMDVDQETYDKLAATEGQSMWGEGNMPPTGKQGPNGWKTVEKQPPKLDRAALERTLSDMQRDIDYFEQKLNSVVALGGTERTTGHLREQVRLTREAFEAFRKQHGL